MELLDLYAISLYNNQSKVVRYLKHDYSNNLHYIYDGVMSKISLLPMSKELTINNVVDLIPKISTNESICIKKLKLLSLEEVLRDLNKKYKNSNFILCRLFFVKINNITKIEFFNNLRQNQFQPIGTMTSGRADIYNTKTAIEIFNELVDSKIKFIEINSNN